MCGKEFNRKSTLIRHEKFHNGEKSFECKCCRKTFGQILHLRKHMIIRKHYNDEKDLYTGGTSYKCGTCKKEFKNKSHLRLHESTHKSEKSTYHCVSYKCEICNKEFKYKYQMNRHKSTHKDEKPYHCEFCGQMLR
ncbi:hypothetical protein ALC62_15424 [Cyphomyrmex costatus]|uniref:C2H2-type domain-containing protein n=1 Tax=Cyphomyrmex costatus TaxID=456900 RepID=A0A151I727_9HYME|nr:hypothetical protein ALC62_15424 [Cyphomyrmex costatus]